MIGQPSIVSFNDEVDLLPVPVEYVAHQPRHFCSRTFSCRLDTEWFLLVNALSGAVDAIRQKDMNMLRAEARRGALPEPLHQVLLTRGYLLRSARQEELYFQGLCATSRNRQGTGLGVHLFVTERCNFHCTYCFESCNRRTSRATRLDMPMASVAPAFRSIRSLRRQMDVSARDVVIKIIGGEPLLPHFLGLMRRILDRCAEDGYSVTVTTNGYHLDRYLPLLHRHRRRISFVLVTLDGPPQVHNQRRPLCNGGETFDRIARNVDQALLAGLKILLRTNVDEMTLRELPRLLALYQKYGWHRQAVALQLHPVFSVSDADGRSRQAMSLDRWQQRLAPLLKRIQRTFRSDAWVNLWGDYIANDLSPLLGVDAVATELSERRASQYFPRVYSCLSQRLYDICYLPDGRIYPCVATAAELRRPLGRYLPRHALDQQSCDRWKRRDVGSVSPCRRCPVSLLCGGMCPVQFEAYDKASSADSCGEYLHRLREYVRIHRLAILRRLQRRIRSQARNGGYCRSHKPK